jgi:uncharacterized membrane protein YkvA (DUF1232 family)
MIKKILKAVIRTVRAICELLHNLPVFSKWWQKCCHACDLLIDYLDGKYRKFPLSTIVMLVVGAIAAFLIPLDLIPDVIPFFGQLDDVSVIVSLIALTATKDINEYVEWKEGAYMYLH